jgi:hypothetical protein
MDLLGDIGHVKSRFYLFRDRVVLVQYRCTVFATRTIGTEIILDAPDGTLR